jgi:predicted rRNA methylase YqxC with S4 and FtsJ domains
MSGTINWKSTKFIQSFFVQVTGAIALFIGKVDGGTYVALSSLALTIYAVSDVAQKKFEQDAPQ